jgi:hypothetical protein
VRIGAKKRGGSGKRAGPKIEKRQGGKEARGKEPLSRRGIVGKDVEERIGGYLDVPRDASQPRTSFEWDQLTLKKGPNNTGQEGEPKETDKQRKLCRCAGVQEHEPISMASRIGLVE